MIALEILLGLGHFEGLLNEEPDGLEGVIGDEGCDQTLNEGSDDELDGQIGRVTVF